MEQQPEVTTVPPVHHAGPDTQEREIVGGDTVARVGLDSLLRDAFETVGNDLAVKHTTMPIVVPVRQLVDATVRVIGDLPRIPDYDDVSAHKQQWSETQSYSPVELPEDEPKTLGVNAEGAVVVVRANLGSVDDDVRLDPDHAEGFFLAGLAAARQAKANQAEAERMREQVRGALIVPEGFSRR